MFLQVQIFIIMISIFFLNIHLTYIQALVLNNASRRQSTAGEMVNLMSIDTQRLVDLVTYINMLWSSPLQILIAIYFLSVTMGISILAGVGVLVLLIPVNLLVTRQARRQQVNIDVVLRLVFPFGTKSWYNEQYSSVQFGKEPRRTVITSAFCQSPAASSYWGSTLSNNISQNVFLKCNICAHGAVPSS